MLSILNKLTKIKSYQLHKHLCAASFNKRRYHFHEQLPVCIEMLFLKNTEVKSFRLPVTESNALADTRRYQATHRLNNETISQCRQSDRPAARCGYNQTSCLSALSYWSTNSDHLITAKGGYR